MNNFLEFIKNDIESKKTLLASMPLNNVTNIKKYNEKIASMFTDYSYYKERLHHIILLQRFIREHLNYVNYRVEKIQSFWRGYWLRKIIYVRLIMFYKGQALIEHIMNFYSKLGNEKLVNVFKDIKETLLKGIMSVESLYIQENIDINNI